MIECSVSHHAQDGGTTYNLHFTTQGLLQIVNFLIDLEIFIHDIMFACRYFIIFT